MLPQCHCATPAYTYILSFPARAVCGILLRYRHPDRLKSALPRFPFQNPLPDLAFANPKAFRIGANTKTKRYDLSKRNGMLCFTHLQLQTGIIP